MMTATASLGMPPSSGTPVVKQERQDDPEIVALAEKMRVANEARLAQLLQRPMAALPLGSMLRPGQQAITSYYGRNIGIRPGLPGSAQLMRPPAPPPPADDENALDINSKKGRFGWHPFKKEYIPYIFRQEEKFCAVRMVETKLLHKFLPHLPTDIVSCTCIRSYFITDDEAKLLNEINEKHCGGMFSKEGQFSSKDLVVLLNEAKQFYEFLETCFRKIVLGTHDANIDRCGFFRINGDSVVPYTVKNGDKFVPLFYFEGETDRLRAKSVKIEGWELSYLKFCCKVQGIRNELFATDSCPVVSLNDIKQHFPERTDFQEYWPSNIAISAMPAVAQQIQQNVHTQHRQLAQANVVAQQIQQNVHSQQRQLAQANVPKFMNHPNLNGVVGSWSGGTVASTQALNPSYQAVARFSVPTAQNIVAAQQVYTLGGMAAPPSRVAAAQANSAALRNSAYPLQVVGNPTKGAQLVNGQVAQSFTVNMDKSGQNQATVQWQQQIAQANANGMRRMPARQPPALLPMNTAALLNNVLRAQQQQQQQAASGSSRVQTALRMRRPAQQDDDIIDLSSPPSSPLPAAGHKDNRIPLHQIAQVGPGMARLYAVRKVLIQNKQLYAITMDTNQNSELLVRVRDVYTQFYPTCKESDLQRAFQVLGASLYKLNDAQTQAFINAGVSMPSNLIVPMVLKSDVERFTLQLTYMMTQNNMAKRQRTQ